MLGACQRRPATVAGKPEEIFRHQRYRAPRAPLPRRVSRRIDDDLTNDSPTRMVRIAARNQEPGQRLGYPYSSGLGPVTVQVPQRGTHVPAAVDRPGELPGSPSRLCVVHHRSLHRTRPEVRAPCWTPTTSGFWGAGRRVWRAALGGCARVAGHYVRPVSRPDPQTTPPLRLWQTRALDAMAGWERGSFLLSAAPGAGKTRPALKLARGQLASGAAGSVVVACPTGPLTRQCARGGEPAGDRAGGGRALARPAAWV